MAQRVSIVCDHCGKVAREDRIHIATARLVDARGEELALVSEADLHLACVASFVYGQEGLSLEMRTAEREREVEDAERRRADLTARLEEAERAAAAARERSVREEPALVREIDEHMAVARGTS